MDREVPVLALAYGFSVVNLDKALYKIRNASRHPGVKMGNDQLLAVSIRTF